MIHSSTHVKNLAPFVEAIAKTLRGDFKQSEYGKIILPFVVLRRLDCLLADSKDAVLEAKKNLPPNVDEETQDMMLFSAVGNNVKVYNLSRFTFETLKGQDARQLHKNLIDYITSFSSNVRDIFLEKFLFTDQLKRLNEAGILWHVFEKFTEIDLHPDTVTNIEMGYLFEELIRRFSEMSNETAGEHFTPREVISLIVELLIANDDSKLTGKGIIRQVYDPACGTGGMLVLTEEALKAFNEDIRVELFGQERNPESFGICKSDMLITGHEADQIGFLSTLTNDAHSEKKFHYMLSNPPYGVDWKKDKVGVVAEHKGLGFNGRFGAGLPRISDGQLLFLQHMISKMRDDETGSRIGIVMNGSPLFTGGAGSGESEIRRWILENDWLEAIVALPTDLFYNTDIQTYIWLLNNRKPSNRERKVQLIDASGERFYDSMRKALAYKKKEISNEAKNEIVRLYEGFLNGESGEDDVSKIFDASDFGFREIRIERPLKLNFEVSPDRIHLLVNEKLFQKLTEQEQSSILRFLKKIPNERYINRASFESELIKVFKSENFKLSPSLKKAILSALSERDQSADTCTDAKGNPEADTSLRDHELIPLSEDYREYFKREVFPFVPDAWVDKNYTDKQDKEVGRVGYAINFNKHFFKFQKYPPVNSAAREVDKIRDSVSELLSGLMI